MTFKESIHVYSDSSLFYFESAASQGINQNQPIIGKGKIHSKDHQPFLPASLNLLTVADKVGTAMIGR